MGAGIKQLLNMFLVRAMKKLSEGQQIISQISDFLLDHQSAVHIYWWTLKFGAASYEIGVHGRWVGAPTSLPMPTQAAHINHVTPPCSCLLKQTFVHPVPCQSSPISLSGSQIARIQSLPENQEMGLQEFEECAEKSKTLPDSTTNENKLILYGLYKQATVGPVNTSQSFWLKSNLNLLAFCIIPYFVLHLLWDSLVGSAGRPGMFNMKDRAKWDAWKAVEGSREFSN
ncbi:hypothetical protein SAY86_010469 [Trapa natans]|uniref:ACB domain-containing protein n=1 Tax=Trapa natans TaxID=22666 RepID=A0AAN7LW15_TRANT|nr:hypothetical protein SAY86_010469 [Trapa natans]